MRKFATRSDFAAYLRSESYRQKTEDQEEIHYEPPTQVTLSTHTQESEHGAADGTEQKHQLDYCHATNRWKLEYEDGKPVRCQDRYVVIEVT